MMSLKTARIGYFIGSGLSTGTPIFSMFPGSIFCIISAYSQAVSLTVIDGHCSSRHHIVTQKVHQKIRHYFFPYFFSFFLKKKEVFSRIYQQLSPLRVIGPKYMPTHHWQGTKPVFWLRQSEFTV